MENSENLNERRFSSLAEQLEATERQAEFFGDQERIEGVREIRSAISSEGLSFSGIGHSTDSEAQKEGDKMAIASYQVANDQFYGVGADRLIGGAKAVGLGIREFVGRVMRHEKTHQTSRQAEGAGKTDGILVQLFGERAVHDTEEAAASVHTPFDAYDAERGRVDGYAKALKITRMELNQIRVEGDHVALLEHAQNAGVKPIAA